MSISSRTPEGFPSRCVLCGAKTKIEFSNPAQDATCPNCGHLLWQASQTLEQVGRIFGEQLGADPRKITSKTPLADLGIDSLDYVEMMMMLAEEFDFEIPEDEVENIRTIGDFVRYIEEFRRRGRE